MNQGEEQREAGGQGTALGGPPQHSLQMRATSSSERVSSDFKWTMKVTKNLTTWVYIRAVLLEF